MRNTEILMFVTAIAISWSAGLAHAELINNPQESPVVVNKSESVTRVNADGSFYIQSATIRTLLQESARQEFGVSQFEYDPQVDKIQVRGFVKTDDKVTEVPKNEIEDTPVASDGYGFHSEHQVTINFTNVKVGTTIKVDFSGHMKPSTSGDTHFSTSEIFGSSELLVLKSRAIYISDNKLFTWVHDPEHFLNITEEVVPQVKVNGQTYSNQHVLTIELARPIYKGVRNESDVTVNGAIFPWVDISNKDNWAEAAEVFGKKYEERITAPLPPGFESDYEAISKLGTDEEKLAAVMAAVQARAVYFGDWRLAEDGEVPHFPAQVEKVGKADCKDMATASVAILRKLGFADSHVAIIYRGFNPLISPFPMSVVDRFNHAIVYVKTSTGKVYWIDPTNQESYLGINPDIMDRPAVVIEPNGKSFEAMTPLPDTAHNALVVAGVVTPKTGNQGNDAHFSVDVKLSGLVAREFTTASLGTIKERTDRIILTAIAGDPDSTSNVVLAPYSLPERIPHDQEFKASYDKKDFFMQTSEGLAWRLQPPGELQVVAGADEKRVTDIALGVPHLTVNNTTLAGMKLKGINSLSCNIDTKWVKASRQVREDKTGVEISSSYAFASDHITASDFGAPEFKQMQDKMRSCFGSYTLILAKKSEGFHFFQTWSKQASVAASL